MAEIRKRGNSWIYQVSFRGKRVTFTFGNVSQMEANIAAGHLARIVAARSQNLQPPAESVAWVLAANERIRKTLIRHDLHLTCEDYTVRRLVKEFNADYERVHGLSDRTIVRMRQYSQKLTDFFGDRLITDLTAIEARKFLSYLQQEYPAEATWTKGLQRCKQVFNWALDHEIIQRSPLKKLRGGRYENEKKMHYVTVDCIEDVMDMMPDGDLKTAVALSRYGGLRVPSELGSLTWERVNLVKRVMIVWDVKRKRDKAVPIFPPLAEILENQQEKFGDSTHVIVDPVKRAPQANLRKEFSLYIERAGYSKWPRPFQNMRASCETDLMKVFPIHQVVKWIGNSSKVALKHYAMVTDQDVAEAAATPVFSTAKQGVKAEARSLSSTSFPSRGRLSV